MIERKEDEASTGPPPRDRAPARAPEAKALLPAPPKRHRGTGILWLLLFGAIGYWGFRYYQGTQQKAAADQASQAVKLAQRPVSIAAAAARRADMPIYLRGLGTVTAFNTVNVKSRVDGPLVKVNYTEGQNVKLGDVLVEIDPRTYQAIVEQAEGQLARDQAQLNDAKVNLARYQKLSDEGVIAKQMLDTQASQVGQFQGAIEADQANIDSAKLNLSFTNVTAPMSGRIGLRLVDVGNIVHASDTNALAVITQMQPITILFTIPSDSLQPVLAKLNAHAVLPVDAYDRADRNKISSGTLLTVDNQIDPTTGTSRLKAVFENTDSALFPNQFVNCRLLLDTKHGVVMISAPAIQRGPQGTYVYLVKPDHTATMRTIAIGTTEGNDVEVTSGLAFGDMVVTDGQDKLQEGSNVEIRPDSGVPAQAGTSVPASKPVQVPVPAARGRK